MDTQITWEPALVVPGSLADNALTTLRAFFDAKHHHPSEQHWEALRDVAETMEAMADGTCEPRVFLSSIDCGVGKSQTVVHFARALVASPNHDDVGMLVCVGRIAEAEVLAETLADVPTARRRAYERPGRQQPERLSSRASPNLDHHATAHRTAPR